MREIQRLGKYADIVEALSPSNPDLKVLLGLRETAFQQNFRLHLATAIAQYHGLVQDGLVNAQHLFLGLKRNLMEGDDLTLGESVLVYCWRPEKNFIWSGSPEDGRITWKIPPSDEVFVVLVRPEPQPETFSNVGTVVGSIEKWNWVKEDPGLLGAPIDSADRFVQKHWSREL